MAYSGENTSCATSVSCLESLVGLQSACPDGDCYRMYIESAGFTKQGLAKIARSNEMTAANLVKNAVKFSAQEMLGDIEGVINGGFSLKSIQSDICSACELSAVYQAGGGVIVKNMQSAKFGMLRITSLNVLCNDTGSNVIILDDGVNETEVEIETVAGTRMPVKLDYQTFSNTVKIRLQNAAVGMGKVVCATPSGCGCGRKQTTTTISLSGLLNGIADSTQYGFLVCASAVCDADAMICRIADALPNKVALVLFYKVASKIYKLSLSSERNNNEAGFGDDDKISQDVYYERLYWAAFKGTSAVQGLRHLIGGYLSKNADKCVVCKTNRSIGYATG